MPPDWLDPDGFPHHREPDGNRFAPHHEYIGCLAVLVIAWASSLAAGMPWLTVVGTLTSLFCFAFFWYDLGRYPTVGAFGASAGLVVAAVGLLAADPFLLPHRLAAGVGVLVAADDVLQHATGARTPLDELWRRFIFGHLD